MDLTGDRCLFQEPKFVLPLPQRSLPCSLIAETLGVRHGDLGLTDSCGESD